MGSVEFGEGVKKVLAQLGLTDYERRVYLVLLKNGPLEADAISKHADVPYSRIYEVLNALIGKRWVEADESRPKTYYPKSPSEAFTTVKADVTEKLRSWEKIVLETLQPVYDKRTFRERPDIWILRGEYDALLKLNEMLTGVKHELMIAVPSASTKWLEMFLEELVHLANKGVRIQLMTSEGNDQLTRFSRFSEVRKRDSMFGGGVIADSREALLVLGEKEELLLIWSNHLGLVKLAKDYFDYLWEDAEVIK